jgi:hypothetical protein
MLLMDQTDFRDSQTIANTIYQVFPLRDPQEIFEIIQQLINIVEDKTIFGIIIRDFIIISTQYSFNDESIHQYEINQENEIDQVNEINQNLLNEQNHHTYQPSSPPDFDEFLM